jgi:hydroxyacylglutathione hydrolase
VDFGGNVNRLYETFAEQLANLPDNTLVYPGHDYIENNLRFTLAREPDNAAAQKLLPLVTQHDPETSVVTALIDEKQHNTFFRLSSSSVIAKLRESFPDLPDSPDAQEVFVKLRELRNSW